MTFFCLMAKIRCFFPPFFFFFFFNRLLHKPKLLLIIDLLPFAKIVELLAINHSLSERRDNFVPQLMKLSHILVVLQLARVCISPQLSWITQSGLFPVV